MKRILGLMILLMMIVPVFGVYVDAQVPEETDLALNECLWCLTSDVCVRLHYDTFTSDGVIINGVVYDYIRDNYTDVPVLKTYNVTFPEDVVFASVKNVDFDRTVNVDMREENVLRLVPGRYEVMLLTETGVWISRSFSVPEVTRIVLVKSYEGAVQAEYKVGFIGADKMLVVPFDEGGYLVVMSRSNNVTVFLMGQKVFSQKFNDRIKEMWSEQNRIFVKAGDVTFILRNEGIDFWFDVYSVDPVVHGGGWITLPDGRAIMLDHDLLLEGYSDYVVNTLSEESGFPVKVIDLRGEVNNIDVRDMIYKKGVIVFKYDLDLNVDAHVVFLQEMSIASGTVQGNFSALRFVGSGSGGVGSSISAYRIYGTVVGELVSGNIISGSYDGSKFDGVIENAVFRDVVRFDGVFVRGMFSGILATGTFYDPVWIDLTTRSISVTTDVAEGDEGDLSVHVMPTAKQETLFFGNITIGGEEYPVFTTKSYMTEPVYVISASGRHYVFNGDFDTVDVVGRYLLLVKKKDYGFDVNIYTIGLTPVSNISLVGEKYCVDQQYRFYVIDGAVVRVYDIAGNLLDKVIYPVKVNDLSVDPEGNGWVVKGEDGNLYDMDGNRIVFKSDLFGVIDDRVVYYRKSGVVGYIKLPVEKHVHVNVYGDSDRLVVVDRINNMIYTILYPDEDGNYDVFLPEGLYDFEIYTDDGVNMKTVDVIEDDQEISFYTMKVDVMIRYGYFFSGKFLPADGDMFYVCGVSVCNRVQMNNGTAMVSLSPGVYRFYDVNSGIKTFVVDKDTMYVDLVNVPRMVEVNPIILWGSYYLPVDAVVIMYGNENITLPVDVNGTVLLPVIPNANYVYVNNEIGESDSVVNWVGYRMQRSYTVRLKYDRSVDVDAVFKGKYTGETHYVTGISGWVVTQLPEDIYDVNITSPYYVAYMKGLVVKNDTFKEITLQKRFVPVTFVLKSEDGRDLVGKVCVPKEENIIDCKQGHEVVFNLWNGGKYNVSVIVKDYIPKQFVVIPEVQRNYVVVLKSVYIAKLVVDVSPSGIEKEIIVQDNNGTVVYDNTTTEDEIVIPLQSYGVYQLIVDGSKSGFQIKVSEVKVDSPVTKFSVTLLKQAQGGGGGSGSVQEVSGGLKEKLFNKRVLPLVVTGAVVAGLVVLLRKKGKGVRLKGIKFGLRKKKAVAGVGVFLLFFLVLMGGSSVVADDGEGLNHVKFVVGDPDGNRVGVGEYLIMVPETGEVYKGSFVNGEFDFNTTASVLYVTVMAEGYAERTLQVFVSGDMVESIVVYPLSEEFSVVFYVNGVPVARFIEGEVVDVHVNVMPSLGAGYVRYRLDDGAWIFAEQDDTGLYLFRFTVPSNVSFVKMDVEVGYSGGVLSKSFIIPVNEAVQVINVVYNRTENDIVQLRNELVSLANVVSNMSLKVKEINDVIQGYGEVSFVLPKVNQLEKRVDEINNTIAGLVSKFEGFESSVNLINAKMSGMRQDYENAMNAYEKAMEQFRVERLFLVVVGVISIVSAMASILSFFRSYKQRNSG